MEYWNRCTGDAVLSDFHRFSPSLLSFFLRSLHTQRVWLSMRTLCLHYVKGLLHHNLQDLDVGLLHAEATEATDVVDGLFGVAADDAVAAQQVVAVLAHLEAEQSGLDRQGDLACARRLGTVAHDAGGHAEGVLQSVFDDIKTVTEEEGDAAARGAARADGTTVGREPADAGLLVDGHEVRQSHGANGAFLVDVELFSEGEYGQANRHTLVAAA